MKQKIDLSIQAGTCKAFLQNLYAGKNGYDHDNIRHYPFFNYLLRFVTPNNFRHGKFGIILSLFLEIIKKRDASLVRYFDAFLYQLLKEIDFSHSGLTIKDIEMSSFKTFLHLLSDNTGNGDLDILARNMDIPLRNENNAELREILADMEMLLCYVIVRYKVEEVMRKFSVLNEINLYTINRILFNRYFTRTLAIMDKPFVIPGNILMANPSRMFQYFKTLKQIQQSEDVKRILELELKIFETKFFSPKKFAGYCDAIVMKEKIEDHKNAYPLRVNDTLYIMRGYNRTDLDLEFRRGTLREVESNPIDIMIYFHYLKDKVRCLEYTSSIKEILLFFWPMSRQKKEFLKGRKDQVFWESQINELIFKNILI